MTRCVDLEDCLRLRGGGNVTVTGECSEASGVAVVGVATMRGLGGATSAITGESGGTLAALLQQPMGDEWCGYARQEETIIYLYTSTVVMFTAFCGRILRAHFYPKLISEYF